MSADPPTNPAVRFSLVVCTLRRRDELAELFESLLREGRQDFEVLLVDQNTDDGLVEIVRRFQAHFPLEHIRMAGTGASRARNLGMDHARGELIGFPDDDCRYLDGYLAAVDKVFSEDATISCISGNSVAVDRPVGADWRTDATDLDAVTVLNRCQEFTVFVRRQSLRGLRYNNLLGVGAQTLWGADEAPDLLIRLIHAGCRLVYFPRLLVYHPNKIATITPATLHRAASYARGRGCLFRLHRFPRRTVLNSLFRPAVGCGLYLLRLQPMRSLYYLTIVRNILRGLLMSGDELAVVRRDTAMAASPPSIEPVPLDPLPPQPLVSVLVPNYNYAAFLPAALDSLVAQTYTHWEAVVCDDASTDDSARIVKDYASRDPRIRLVEQANGGQASAVNACYPLLRGRVICLLDSDDLFHPDKIRRVVESFQANPGAGACNHFATIINSTGQPLPVTLNHRLDSGWLANGAFERGACVYVPTTSAMSLRREIADVVFPIPSGQPRDVDGYLGMVVQFLAPVLVIEDQLSGYRIHGHNMGGITEPTPERLGYEMRLIEQRTANVKEFVGNRFGPDLADRIVLKDNPQYIQAALKQLAVGKTDHRLSRALVLVRHHPNKTWRAIWRAIFIAPGPLSRQAVPMMHRSHRVKAMVHRLMGRRGRVAT